MQTLTYLEVGDVRSIVTLAPVSMQRSLMQFDPDLGGRVGKQMKLSDGYHPLVTWGGSHHAREAITAARLVESSQH